MAIVRGTHAHPVVDVEQTLRLCGLLAELTDGEIAALSLECIGGLYARGDIAVWPGECCGWSLLLTYGMLSVECAQWDADRTQVVHHLVAPDVLVEIPRSVTVTAASKEATVYRIPRRRLLAVAAGQPDLVLRLLMSTCEQLDASCEILYERAMEDGDLRLRRALRRLFDLHGTTVIEATQREIASEAGLSRPETSRRLNRIRAEGILDFPDRNPRDRHIRLLAGDRLCPSEPDPE